MDNQTNQSGENQPKPTEYKRHVTAIVAVLAVSLLFFSLTSPTKLPAIFFIVAFILIFGASYAVATILVYLVAFLGGTLGQDRLRPRIRLIKAASATIITVLLGLASIGQLTPRDILTLVVFFGLLYFYVTRLARR